MIFLLDCLGDLIQSAYLVLIFSLIVVATVNFTGTLQKKFFLDMTQGFQLTMQWDQYQIIASKLQNECYTYDILFV